MDTNAFWQLAEWHHPWLATPSPSYDTCSSACSSGSPARVVGFNCSYYQAGCCYEQPADALPGWSPPIMASLSSSLGAQLRTLKPIKTAKRSKRGQMQRRKATPGEQEPQARCDAASPVVTPQEAPVGHAEPAGVQASSRETDECRSKPPAPALAEAAALPIAAAKPSDRRGSAGSSSPKSAAAFPATPSAPFSPWGSHGTPPRKAPSLFEQLSEARAAATSAQEQVRSLQLELSKEREEVASLQEQLKELAFEKQRLMAERAVAYNAALVAPQPAAPQPGSGARRRRRGSRKSKNHNNNNDNKASAAATAQK